MITLRLLGLAGFCRWCGFEAPGPVFFGAKRRERLQFVEFSIFSARPSYSTPLPNHFPGSWCTPEQVSRCGSSHRRLEAFRVDLVHFVHFSLRKRFPKHGKTSSPVQVRFFRGGRHPEVYSERSVRRPRKVSGEFRGVVPRPVAH